MNIDRTFERVVFHLCEDVNTPRALTVSLLLKAKEYGQLFNLKTNPSSYSDAEEYFKDNLVTELIRKLDFEGLIPKDELEDECFQRFLTTERTCHLTNLRLRAFLEGGIHLNDAPLLPVIDNIRKIISKVVGHLPPSLEGGFGPGATLTNSSAYCTIPDKLSSVQSGTVSANYLFRTLYKHSRWQIEDTALFQGRDLDVVRGNRFFTVPKEATKLRGACLSPGINGFLQKGVGNHLKRRLRTVGINIESEPLVSGMFNVNGLTTPDVHRHMAMRASQDGSHATIDLSDASNTIAYQLIKLLFPSDWFLLLDSLREGYVQRPDKKWQKLEMFSAMGNGFTFEVETIVFYAIARSIVGDHGFVSVFGDDIIVPTESAEPVLAALKFFGFTPNERKTFTSGPFRESCGGDFFNGIPVRAHYVKKLPSQPSDWIAFANGLRKLAFGYPNVDHRWRYLRRSWFSILDCIPSLIRLCRGPHQLGDICIHDEESRWMVRFGSSQRFVKVFRPIAKPVSLNHFKPSVQFLSALYGVPSRGPIPRNSISGYRLGWIPFS